MINKVALITGGAKRIGASMVKHLHHQGLNIILHHRHSVNDAKRLADELNHARPNSVVIASLDLNDLSNIPSFAKQATDAFGRLDVLINNASSFYPTPFGNVTQEAWHDLLNSNLTGPYFLCQALLDTLTKHQGIIINILDIKVERPLKGYSAYNIAKAGLWMLTQSLAYELAPNIRVNAVAPGLMLRPETDYLTKQQLNHIKQCIPLKRFGTGDDIAQAVWFLIQHASYMTGQMITVDGGYRLHQGEAMFE